MTPFIGAEIEGVDLSRPLADDTVGTIRQALLDWKVVFFRGQSIEPQQHVAFGRRFGTVSPGHPTLPGLDGHPEVLPLSNRSAVDAAGQALIESEWHTDVTFTPCPPIGSILRSVEVPTCGGDTHWTNLVVAYQRLSPPLRQLVDGLHAVHRNTLHISREGEGLPSHLRAMFTAQPLAALHPVVRVHPETGERSLFVNPTFTSHIVELGRLESRRLLDLLYELMQAPELTVRFRWEPGSVAFWDNRATAHLAPRDLSGRRRPDGSPETVDREMQRITLDGDAPVGPDGSVSRAIDGTAFA